MGRFSRLIALCLSLLTVVGLFAACAAETPETTGSAQTDETTKPTEPQPTQNPEEAKVMKILTLGHSLAVDSCHMLNLVSATEGIGQYEEIVIGTLYYSGCSLGQHVQFMLADDPVYNLYLSSTKTPDAPPTVKKSVTAKEAIVSDHWDIIVMQGKPSELTTGVAYSENGVLGPWVQDKELIYAKGIRDYRFGRDGGHGAIFKSLDGRLMLSIHGPNQYLQKALHCFELDITGEVLRIK